jgi:hypothetical protein
LQGTAASDVPLPDSVLQEISALNLRSKLTSTLLDFFSADVIGEKIKGLRELFKNMDQGNEFI